MYTIVLATASALAPVPNFLANLKPLKMLQRKCSSSRSPQNKAHCNESNVLATTTATPPVPQLTYFDFRAMGFAGRGGAVRFWFLANGQALDEQLVSLSDWQAGLKAKTIESKENVSGHLPIVHHRGRALTEHHAIMRYFARLWGLYGADADRDYLVDKLADASVEWRNTLLEAAFGSDEQKAKYREQQRPDFYRRFEHYVAAHGWRDGFAVGAKLSFADALISTVMWDDVHAFGALPEAEAAAYPRLHALYTRFVALPAVSAWCAGQPRA